MMRFKMLMHNLCLRRTKRMNLSGKPLLKLPPMRQIVHKVRFHI